MAELIYGPSISKIKDSALGNILNATNVHYRALALTSDGHLYNRGETYSFLESLIDTTLNANKIVKWDNTLKKFVLGDDKNEIYYTLKLNGTNYGTSGGTSLGEFYAPTSVQNGILEYNNGWTWRSVVTTIDSTTALPTSGAVKTYVDTLTAGLTGAMHYIGDATVATGLNGTITVTGIPEGHTLLPGDVVVSGNKEYVYNGSTWRELGDEGSYLLKTATNLVKAGTGISISETNGQIQNGYTINLATIHSGLTGSNDFLTGITVDSYGRVSAISTGSYRLATNALVGGIKLYQAADSAAVTIANKSKHALKLDSYGIAYVDIPSLADYISSSAIGATNKGIYWTGSGFSACTYEVNKSVPADAVFTDTNTWRDVQVYKILNSVQSSTISSIGTDILKFSSSFAMSSSGELGLVWAEVDENGTVTYVA